MKIPHPGKYLAEIAERKGLNNEQLSRLSGVSRSTINRFFNHKSDCRTMAFLRICKALGLYSVPDEEKSLPLSKLR